MLVKVTIIAQVFFFVVSCTQNDRKKTDSSMSGGQISEYEKLEIDKVLTELTTKNNEGDIDSLKGFSPSNFGKVLDPKNSGQAGASPSNIKEALASENAIFEFEPPDEFDAEFSEPILITAASLRLFDGSDVCEQASYNIKPPSIRDFVEFANNESLCGEISVYFCFKMSKKSKTNQNVISGFSLSPTITLDIPCHDKTFDELGLKISDDDGIVNSRLVSIEYIAKDNVVDIYITNDSSCESGGDWKVLQNETFDWTLADSTLNLKGEHQVFAKFRDVFDQESPCVSSAISYSEIDNIPPNLTSLIIAGGATTNDTSPDLALAATGASEMYITNTAGCAADGNWEAYANSKAGWTLGQSNVIATVYVKVRDAAGNESACANDTIIHDNQIPTSTSITIDGGAATNDASPDLSLAATGASEMYITNTAGCAADGNWEAYATSKAGWTLGQSNATATVYVKYRDVANNESACINDTITHDGQIPTSTSITIDGGTSTNDASPDLSLAATGASEMYITNTAGCAADGIWEAYAATKAGWVLAQRNYGNGLCQVSRCSE